MPVVEIVSFTASEALLKDPSLGVPAVEYLLKADGCSSIRRGRQVEDPTHAYMTITWETYEHHMKMLEREDYPSFMASMKPNFASLPVAQHINFEDDATNAFNAPVTEIATVKVNEGHSQSEIDEIISQFKKGSHLVKGGHPPLLFGEVKETPGTYLLVIGWDSIEAHKTASTGDVFGPLVAQLFSISDLSAKHVSFKA